MSNHSVHDLCTMLYNNIIMSITSVLNFFLLVKFNVYRCIAKGEPIHLSVVEKPTVELYRRFNFSVRSEIAILILLYYYTKI